MHLTCVPPLDQPTVEIEALTLLRHGKPNILEEAGEVQFDPTIAQARGQSHQQTPQKQQTQHSDGPPRFDKP